MNKKAARVEVNLLLAFLHWVEMALHPWPFVICQQGGGTDARPLSTGCQSSIEWHTRWRHWRSRQCLPQRQRTWATWSRRLCQFVLERPDPDGCSSSYLSDLIQTAVPVRTWATWSRRLFQFVLERPDPDGCSSSYLNDLIQTAVLVRPLRSSDAPLLTVPRTRSELARRPRAPGTHYHLTLDPAVLWTPQDPPVQTVLTWCHQRLCIFGLYGAIEILFDYYIIIIISMGSGSVPRLTG